jgi:hypothetical protein
MANTNCNPHQIPTGDISAFTRNHYFYGKLLTVSDFQLEQDYFINKLRLNNQLLEGVGIIDGLEITNPSFTSDLNKVTFSLSKGHAIDADGNIILVKTDTSITIDNNAIDKANFYICIEYDECEQNSVPIASDDSQCEEEGCCYNRVRETYKVTIQDSASECDYGIACTDEVKVDRKSIVLAVVKKNVIHAETTQYRCTIKSNQMLQGILCNHIDADNPHNVVTSINELKSDVILSKSDAITIAKNGQSITVGETHSANKANPHKVTARQLKALTKLTSKDNSVTITNTPTEPTTLDLKVKSTNNENIAILEKYLRERALKCTVTSFKMVAERFDDKVKKVALDIVENAKKAVDREIFNDIEKFTSFIDKELIEFYEKFIASLNKLNEFNIQISNMEMLEKVVKNLSNSENITEKATLMDEICFYVLQLEPIDYSKQCDSSLECLGGALNNIKNKYEKFPNITSSVACFSKFIHHNQELGVCNDTSKFKHFIKNMKYIYFVHLLSQLSSLEDYKLNCDLMLQISDLDEDEFIFNTLERLQKICTILETI